MTENTYEGITDPKAKRVLKRLENKIEKLKKQIKLLDEAKAKLQDELGKTEAKHTIAYSNAAAREIKTIYYKHRHARKDII